MEIYLNNDHSFSVPVAVADHFLKLASHSQLKILLYVLCHARETLTEEAIVRACNVQPENVEEALTFWQQVNILQNTPPAEVKVSLKDAPSAESPGDAASPAEPAEAKPEKEHSHRPEQPLLAAVQSDSSGFSLSSGEIAERCRENPALAELLQAAQGYAGRGLNPMEINSLLWMVEYLSLSPDIILMLLAYCARNARLTPRYWEKIAVEWQERGVTTHSLVQEDLQRRQKNETFTGEIKKLFEMHRDPTAKQQSIIASWQEAGFSLPLIKCAYEEALENTNGQHIFPYTDAILQRWRQKNILTPELAEQDQEKRKAFIEQILELLEKDRKLTSNDFKYMDSWRDSGFSIPLIQCALEEAKGQYGEKFSFRNMDAVLRQWRAENVLTPEQAEQARRSPRNVKQSSKKKPASQITQLGFPSTFDPADVEALRQMYGI